MSFEKQQKQQHRKQMFNEYLRRDKNQALDQPHQRSQYLQRFWLSVLCLLSIALYFSQS